MSEPDSQPLDFTLHWRETQAPRSPQDDAITLGAEPSAEQAELQQHTGETPADDLQAWDSQEADDAGLDDQESFQWSAEREAELEAALAATPADAPARVHQQLCDILSALEDGSLQHERAALLLGEVETYLSERILAEQRKPPVTHHGFMGYRADKLNALYAWQEAASALKAYLSERDEIQLRVARYAADQAASFLLTAWEMLQAAEPELADDLDERDDSDDDATSKVTPER